MPVLNRRLKAARVEKGPVSYTHLDVYKRQMLYQHYHKKVIILLDEYDTPMINAYEQGYYEDVRFFFKSLYGSALKDNPYLERAMLTGIHRIAKESIFSDLNNLDVYTVLDKEFSDCFGLTPCLLYTSTAFAAKPMCPATAACGCWNWPRTAVRCASGFRPPWT